MKTYNINTDTPLIPYIIAERAIWNVLEDKHKDLSPEKCYELEQAISPQLVERAEYQYANNDFFRKQINKKKNDPRYVLEMFMEHWTLSILRKIKIDNYLKTNLLNL